MCARPLGYKINRLFSHQCIFFLHQTLVFCFYQFISVCALRGREFISDWLMGQGERRVRSSVNPIIQIDSSQLANFFQVFCSVAIRDFFSFCCYINTIYFPWKTCWLIVVSPPTNIKGGLIKRVFCRTEDLTIRGAKFKNFRTSRASTEGDTINLTFMHNLLNKLHTHK